jgi:hypothetical protein
MPFSVPTDPLVVLTTLVANIVVSFLHGIVPIILANITDAIAALIAIVLAPISEAVLLIGAIISLISLLRSPISWLS